MAALLLQNIFSKCSLYLKLGKDPQKTLKRVHSRGHFKGQQNDDFPSQNQKPLQNTLMQYMNFC